MKERIHDESTDAVLQEYRDKGIGVLQTGQFDVDFHYYLNTEPKLDFIYELGNCPKLDLRRTCTGLTRQKRPELPNGLAEKMRLLLKSLAPFSSRNSRSRHATNVFWSLNNVIALFFS